MNKSAKQIIYLMILIAIFTSCSKNEDNAPSNPDVYVVGFVENGTKSKGMLWKNDVAIPLNTQGDARATAVFVK